MAVRQALSYGAGAATDETARQANGGVSMVPLVSAARRCRTGRCTRRHSGRCQAPRARGAAAGSRATGRLRERAQTAATAADIRPFIPGLPSGVPVFRTSVFVTSIYNIIRSILIANERQTDRPPGLGPRRRPRGRCTRRRAGRGDEGLPVRLLHKRRRRRRGSRRASAPSSWEPPGSKGVVESRRSAGRSRSARSGCRTPRRSVGCRAGQRLHAGRRASRREHRGRVVEVAVVRGSGGPERTARWRRQDWRCGEHGRVVLLDGLDVGGKGRAVPPLAVVRSASKVL